MSKETWALGLLAMTLVGGAAVVLLHNMVSPYWDDTKTWVMLVMCLSPLAIISAIGAFFAFGAWKDDREEARTARQAKREQRQVDMYGRAAQLAGYDQQATKQALGAMESALRASMTQYQRQFHIESAELRRDRLLQPVQTTTPAQVGLIWSEDDWQEETDDDQNANGAFWI